MKRICQICGRPLGWHGDILQCWLCDHCDSDIISKALRDDLWEDIEREEAKELYYDDY